MKALCLAGGGARGVVQVGMIVGYFDKFKDYDGLFGTSVGCLNGTFVHMNEVSTLVKIWSNIRNKDIYNWSFTNAFTSKASIFDSQPLENLINKNLNLNKMIDNPKPFYISMTQIDPLKAITMRMPDPNDVKNTAKYILASASAPIAFPTQEINGIQYTDGGITRNFGIEHAISLGYDDITVLWPSSITNKAVKNLTDMIALQLSAQGAGQYQDESDVARILDKSKHQVTLTVYNPSTLNLGMLDFDKAGKNFDSYFHMGYDLLNKPSLSVRRIIKN